MKDKMKSYSFWTALSGATVVLLQALGDCFGFSVQSEVVSGIIMAVAGILVVFGIVSMPNKSQNENKYSVNEENKELTEDNLEINQVENANKSETNATNDENLAK